MNTVVKMSVMVLLVIIGLIFMMLEAENGTTLIMTKVIGAGLFAFVYHLYGKWEEEINNVIK